MSYSHLSVDHLNQAINKVSVGKIWEETDTKTDISEKSLREVIH